MLKIRIYLDNSSTTKVDPLVVKEINKYHSEIYGNASSLHQFGREAKEAMDDARERFAKIINAEADEVIFTSGGSESDNLAIKGTALVDFKESNGKKNHIITTRIEHPAVLNTCEELSKDGFKVTYLKVNKEGFVDLDELKKSINDATIIVSVIHANNEIGTIQDIEKIGKICRERKVYFHTDAVQSFTKTDIDVKKMNIDLASFSAHKIHGPKGIGALYIKKGTRIKRLIDGGSQEFNKRAGTENIPGIMGFVKAAELNKDKKHREHMKKLRDKLIDGLFRNVPELILNGPRNEGRLCNNANIIFKFIEGEAMLLHLDMRGIAVSTGSACSSRSLKPSHVLMSIGHPPHIAHGSIRFSISRFTTEEEIDEVLKAVPEVVCTLRRISPINEKFDFEKEKKETFDHGEDDGDEHV